VEVVVGRLGRPHGIRGEVAVDVRTDEPEARFAPGSRIATDPAERGPLTVVRSRWHSGRMLVAFEGVDDRTAAEALRGTLLVADSSTSPPSEDPDEFWDHELVGLSVVTADQPGDVVGVVAEVMHLPSQDILVVTRTGGGEVLVPFVAEIAVDVDVVTGRIVVAPPPGLLDPVDPAAAD